MTYAFSDALKITDAKELEQAFGIAATGAKLGSFELKDMAKSTTRHGKKPLQPVVFTVKTL